MSEKSLLIALDQGTTSSRAVLYDLEGRELAAASRPLAVSFPRDGWVEQQPEDILETQLDALREILRGESPGRVAALGLTNQRETIVCWERSTGKPLGPAIVWQCRRSAPICEVWREVGLEPIVRRKTGLTIDAYFSASKIRWLIESSPEIAAMTGRGSAVFGTVDSWLIYNLTGGPKGGRFLTEPSNASRTMLYDINRLDWDDELVKLCGISRANLPVVLPSSGSFGMTAEGIPITAVLGDQQASLYGHGCVEKASMKCTFGTGAFLLVNMGERPPAAARGLVSTIGWRSGRETIYAEEGSVFIAGALIQWLRDKLGIISSAAQSEELASSVPNSGGVVIVPAFVGLGAPYWDPSARGSIQGLTRDSSAAHIARAALEGVAHQVVDLLDSSSCESPRALSIDGGMSANGLFCQILADLTRLEIRVPPRSEITAFGAAQLAFAASGLVEDDDEARSRFGLGAGPGEHRTYRPLSGESETREMRERWVTAIQRSRGRD